MAEIARKLINFTLSSLALFNVIVRLLHVYIYKYEPETVCKAKQSITRPTYTSIPLTYLF